MRKLDCVGGLIGGGAVSDDHIELDDPGGH